MFITQTDLRVMALEAVVRVMMKIYILHGESQERDSMNMIQPYMFEPVESDSSGEHVDSEEMASASSSSSGQTTRLQDTNW